MIREAVQQFIRDKHNENPGKWEKEHAGYLEVSDLGHCPRKALLRIAGVVWEAETKRSCE